MADRGGRPRRGQNGASRVLCLALVAWAMQTSHVESAGLPSGAESPAEVDVQVEGTGGGSSVQPWGRPSSPSPSIASMWSTVSTPTGVSGKTGALLKDLTENIQVGPGGDVLVDSVTSWVDKKHREGHSSPDRLMEAVLRLLESRGLRLVTSSGSPSTRTDILRRAQNRLGISAADLSDVRLRMKRERSKPLRSPPPRPLPLPTPPSTIPKKASEKKKAVIRSQIVDKPPTYEETPEGKTPPAKPPRMPRPTTLPIQETTPGTDYMRLVPSLSTAAEDDERVSASLPDMGTSTSGPPVDMLPSLGTSRGPAVESMEWDMFIPQDESVDAIVESKRRARQRRDEMLKREQSILTELAEMAAKTLEEDEDLQLGEEKEAEVREEKRSFRERHGRKIAGLGLLAVVAAALGAFWFAHKKIKKRRSLADPIIYQPLEDRCVLRFNLAKGRALGGIGTVQEVTNVMANNRRKVLQIDYIERPALRSSRGFGEMWRWLKSKVTLGRKLAKRSDFVPFPEKCMAGLGSGYEVAFQEGAKEQSVRELVLDLNFDPGLMRIPRRVMPAQALLKLMNADEMEHDDHWEVYPGCRLHLSLPTELLDGPPLLQLHPSTALLSFANEGLEEFSVQAPLECDARRPWVMQLLYTPAPARTGGLRAPVAEKTPETAERETEPSVAEKETLPPTEGTAVVAGKPPLGAEGFLELVLQMEEADGLQLEWETLERREGDSLITKLEKERRGLEDDDDDEAEGDGGDMGLKLLFGGSEDEEAEATPPASSEPLSTS